MHTFKKKKKRKEKKKKKKKRPLKEIIVDSLLCFLGSIFHIFITLCFEQIFHGCK